MCTSSVNGNTNSIDTNNNGKGKRNYYALLEARRIKTRWHTKWIRSYSDYIARTNPAFLIVVAIFFCTFLGYFLPQLNGAKTELYEEVKTQLHVDEADTRKLKGPERNRVRRDILTSPEFDGDIFKSWLLVFGLILAFTRWQIGNRQSAMSEMFERKQSVNNHIIDNQKKIGALVSDALKTKREIRQNARYVFEISERDQLVQQFRDDEFTEKNQPCFHDKMFVYIELDNLEFAQMKYESGYLEAEQMYRACQIFESRCGNGLFRKLAAIQGIDYYTEEFHDLLKTLILFGYAHSDDNNSE